MKNIPKKVITIQNIKLPLWFFKHTKMQFKKMSTHLDGSFDCDFTHKQMQKLQNKSKHTNLLMRKQT